jgi:polyhydroxyalkanoate synthesis regulator phasin
MSASSSSDRPPKSRRPKGGKRGSGQRAGNRPSGARQGQGSAQRRTSRAAAGRLSAPETKGNGLANLTEQLVNRILKPLGLMVLSRERIAETVHDAVARGRLTRSDAEQLVAELVQRGRQQTDELLSDLDRGRQHLDVATRRARQATSDRFKRGADLARRTIGVGPSFPILGYDDLTVSQVQSRLPHLSYPELRTVRDYERRHANRKSVLGAIEKALG